MTGGRAGAWCEWREPFLRSSGSPGARPGRGWSGRGGCGRWGRWLLAARCRWMGRGLRPCWRWRRSSPGEGPGEVPCCWSLARHPCWCLGREKNINVLRKCCCFLPLKKRVFFNPFAWCCWSFAQHPCWWLGREGKEHQCVKKTSFLNPFDSCCWTLGLHHVAGVLPPVSVLVPREGKETSVHFYCIHFYWGGGNLFTATKSLENNQ